VNSELIEYCDRYREPEFPNRYMLASKNAKVDLSKWKLISSGAAPPKKAMELAAKGFVIIQPSSRRRARRRNACGAPDKRRPA